MSTLCFGGSFNPIHNGHLICARTVSIEKGFDRVLLIPSARPPHKAEDANLAAAHHRLAMCQLVAAEDPIFQASDIEIQRDGRSYTIETARDLGARGEAKVNWLI